MALYIPHNIFHLAWLLYVRPETFGPYYVRIICAVEKVLFNKLKSALVSRETKFVTLEVLKGERG